MASRLRDDRGVAMIVVVGVMVVLFALTTMLIILVNYSTGAEQRQEIRVKEIHLADAGINAYLYELRRDPNYYKTPSNLKLGPTAQDDGVWFVNATPPTAEAPLTLRADGRLNSQTASRTVVATVRFPSFADYMFLCNTNIRVGAGAKIVGRVRVNGWLDNAGWITGVSMAGGSITSQSTARWGPEGLTGAAAAPWRLANQPTVEFSKVLADIDSIRTSALLNSPQTAFPASGNTNGGYIITFQGDQFTVSKFTSVSGSGVFSGVAPVGVYTYAIPPNGVIHVQDNVWVSGKYSKPCTVASSNSIYIPSSITRVDENATYGLGLIAKQNIIVPTEYSTISSVATTSITAAMLAQSGTIYGTLVQGIVKHGVHIRGSMSYDEFGYFASGSPATMGFKTRVYQYDWNLENYPPPMYPQLKSGALRVNTWVED